MALPASREDVGSLPGQPADVPPEISVIVPTFNEVRHIRHVLMALLEQATKRRFEIVVVDGGSTDGTLDAVREVAKVASERASVLVLEIAGASIPAALNSGISRARGHYIIRLDGHSIPPANFIEALVEAHESGRQQQIIGGRWRVRAGRPTLVAEAIGFAVSQPLGAGNAAYRTLRTKGAQGVLVDADTVPFGSFRKELWVALGGYDENLLVSEDYDFVLRARRAGARVALHTNLEIVYLARPTFSALAKQYFRYGFWTARLMRKHGEVPAARKLAPLLLLAFLLLSGVVGGPSVSILFLILYLAAIALVTCVPVKQGALPPSQLPLAVWAFATIHGAYGVGNIFGFLMPWWRSRPIGGR